ncbi:uncharacterized protein LAESUDRAFT_675608 [Laetiporus sulphureus 93-53]|uniref:Kinetochore protein SPC25 n=1 Tax=Laetiporus sulphureus 93-53 TaxID=1314785 RepID=A0A165FIP6_9APHY|nr:uncharacterized protein LAESUDRAFT_675608 [Laetiporus sulphureus 93-53]KZT09030.1 hypothetical protein LAESUDRAFT_675608 [Laetiporus sulphureus 93-53]
MVAKSLRVEKIDLAAVLVSQNSQIDLRIEAYEASTRNFLKAVSNYTQRAITEISNRKAAHLSSRKKLLERAHQIEAETNQCKIKEIELIKVLDTEEKEKRDAETSVTTFKRQLAIVKERCSLLDSELEQHRVVAANLNRERNREQGTLNSYAAHVAPEIADCESCLQCSIEGIERDMLLVRFLRLDDADPTREFSMVIDVSSPLYEVPTATPFLPTLPIHLDELNETRDVYAFIRQVRDAFLTAISQKK